MAEGNPHALQSRLQHEPQALLSLIINSLGDTYAVDGGTGNESLKTRYTVGSINEVCSPPKKMYQRGQEAYRFLNGNTIAIVDRMNPGVLCITGYLQHLAIQHPLQL